MQAEALKGQPNVKGKSKEVDIKNWAVAASHVPWNWLNFIVPILSPLRNMTWPWKTAKIKKHVWYTLQTHAGFKLLKQRCSLSFKVSSAEKKKKSSVQLNLCTVLSWYRSIGRKRASPWLTPHPVWLELAEIDLFIGANKMILGPIHLLISSEQHQVSKAAWFKCVSSLSPASTQVSDSV